MLELKADKVVIKDTAIKFIFNGGKRTVDGLKHKIDMDLNNLIIERNPDIFMDNKDGNFAFIGEVKAIVENNTLIMTGHIHKGIFEKDKFNIEFDVKECELRGNNYYMKKAKLKNIIYS